MNRERNLVIKNISWCTFGATKSKRTINHEKCLFNQYYVLRLSFYSLREWKKVTKISISKRLIFMKKKKRSITQKWPKLKTEAMISITYPTINHDAYKQQKNTFYLSSPVQGKGLPFLFSIGTVIPFYLFSTVSAITLPSTIVGFCYISSSNVHINPAYFSVFKSDL